MKLSVLNCLISCSALKYCILLIDCLLGIKSRKLSQWMNGCIFGCFLMYSQNCCPLTRITFFPATRWGRKGKGSLNLSVLNVLYFPGSLILLSCPHAVQLHYNLRTIWIYKRVYMMDWVNWVLQKFSLPVRTVNQEKIVWILKLKVTFA